jgi:hypothetical protein
MAHNSGNKRSQKNALDSYSDSEDEVCDELSSLFKGNDKLVDLLDYCDHMLREAKNIRKELRALLEDVRNIVAELETQNLDVKLEIDLHKSSHVVSDEVDYAGCSVVLVDLTTLREKHASMCEELDVLRVELAELQSRPTFLGACTSCPALHEKIAEFCSRIVSLEAELKVPITTSCSTCELHIVNNLELAQCVDHLQDENNKLCEVLSWLSSHEPQLGVLIASALMVGPWDLISLVRAVVRDKGNLGIFQLHHNPQPKTSLHPNQTSFLNRKRNQVRSQVRSLVRNKVGSLVRRPVKSLIPSLGQNQFILIVCFVGMMVISRSFDIRKRERREWLRSGQTRTGTTLLMVCLSLVCHYLTERVL